MTLTAKFELCFVYEMVQGSDTVTLRFPSPEAASDFTEIMDGITRGELNIELGKTLEGNELQDS